MRRNAAPSKPRRVRLLATALVAASFLLVAAALDETPRIPGAVTACPAWLKKGAPFDVEKFFATPAAAKNAAPLYLDAFAEFSPDVVACLPASQQSRAEVAKDRTKRLHALNDSLGGQSASLDREATDALLDELHDGFRKLAAAQKRPQCVFATGLTLDSLTPHAQTARDVARAINLRVFRDVEKGDLDRPIQDLAVGFRLSRDLQPRGWFICQLVGVAIDGSLCYTTLPTILGSSLLKVEHCDRLIAVLREHETAGLDRFTTGAKAEYVMQRVMIHAFEDKREVKSDGDGPAPEAVLTKADLAKLLIHLVEGARLTKPPVRTKEEAEALLARHGASWAKERAIVDEFYQALTGPEAGRYAERMRRFKALVKAHMAGRDVETFWLGPLIIPECEIMALSMARGDLYVRASECLLALRRWRLTHAGADPTDLAAACKAAKLPGVPIDPFSNAPLKLAIVGGQPVVYSIGPDGVDDRALKDSNLGRKPDGDMLFRLPAAAK